jgi:hypothetical protein
MKAYKVQVVNHMVVSKVEFLFADSFISAVNKARELFSFSGPQQFIKIEVMK